MRETKTNNLAGVGNQSPEYKGVELMKLFKQMDKKNQTKNSQNQIEQITKWNLSKGDGKQSMVKTMILRNFKMMGLINESIFGRMYIPFAEIKLEQDVGISN